MCIKCELKKIALRLAGKEEKETVLGTVDPQLILNMQLAQNAVEKIEEDLEAEIDLLVKQDVSAADAAVTLAAKYETGLEDARALYRKTWDAIFTAVGVADPKVGQGRNYQINRETNEVSFTEIVDLAPAAEGVH
jgi:hypothetical protein